MILLTLWLLWPWSQGPMPTLPANAAAIYSFKATVTMDNGDRYITHDGLRYEYVPSGWLVMDDLRVVEK